MVNEEHLRHMIKMSMYDTDDGKECKPMEQYARKDYVSLRMLGSFVAGTIGFGLLFAMWILYTMDELMEGLNSMDIQGTLISIVAVYLIFMVIYLTITYLVYNARYTRGRKKVKKYYNSVKKLNRIYEREDKLKMSDNKAWD